MRVLSLEDDASFAELLGSILQGEGISCELQRVETRAEFIGALDSHQFDIILADHSLPTFDGLSSLEIARSRSPEVPFIFVSGCMGEEMAIECLKKGATDYVLKDRVSRLAPAVRRALLEAEEKRQRRKVLASLSESEERFRLLVENSAEMVAEVLPDGTILYASPNHCRYLGHHTADLAGKNLFGKLFDPADRELLLPSSNSDTAFSTVRAMHLDGSWHWLEVSTHRFVTSTHQQRLVVVSRDVTERKKQLELITEQARLINLAQDAIIAADLEGKVLFWNQGATDLYGWTEPEVRNLPMTTLMFRVPSAFDAHRAEVVEKGFWRGELHHINKQGQEVIVSSRWTLVRDETGSPNGFLIINTDLTDRKRLEDQIQRVKRLETVGTLAGGIAHDFNNILGAILSFVDLAIQDAPPTAHSVKGDMQEIKRAALRAKELVNQVLTFSRQDANPRQPFQPVRLQSIIREALRLIRASAPMGVEIIEKLDPTAPMILAEPTQMHQVVMNLCTNAVQAMSSGKGILTIRLTSAPLSETMVSGLPNLKAGWYAILSVSDTGHGIPQEIRDRIFDPFFTTKPPGVGTGLGLSVVHGIIEAHQGAISVQSGQDQGTIFTVYLPTAYEKQNYQEGLSAGRALPPKPDEAETQTTLPLSVALPGAGQRIMVVDDEHALAVATRRSLERCGFKVTEFSQSIQAWEAFEANPGNYDLILTDLSMPGLGGLELAKKMYALRPELPIIISTGNPPEESQEELKTLGIRKLIQKPCPVRILAETIQQILTPSP